MKTTAQRAKGGPLAVLEDIRRDMRDGHFVREEWDHASPDYEKGRSNKRVLIAGATLLNRQGEDVPFDEALDACLAAILGSKT
jgi:hypothetical protein